MRNMLWRHRAGEEPPLRKVASDFAQQLPLTRRAKLGARRFSIDKFTAICTCMPTACQRPSYSIDSRSTHSRR